MGYRDDWFNDNKSDHGFQTGQPARHRLRLCAQQHRAREKKIFRLTKRGNLTVTESQRDLLHTINFTRIRGAAPTWEISYYLKSSPEDCRLGELCPDDLTSEELQAWEDSFVLVEEAPSADRGLFMGYKVLRVGFDKYLEGRRSYFNLIITNTACSTLWEEEIDYEDDDD